MSVCFALALAGCAQGVAVDDADVLRASNGEPVGIAFSPNDRGGGVFAIFSPDGWTCAGAFGQEERVAAVLSLHRKAPLACDNGDAGTVELFPGRYSREFITYFELNSGVEGMAVFP